MTELEPFMTALLVICPLVFAIAVANHQTQMMRVAMIVALNWLCGFLFVTITGDATPWIFSTTIDVVSAIAVMWHPAGRVHGYIGLFYIFQIAFHAMFGLQSIMGKSPDDVFYYDMVTYIAWAQLLTLGGWCGGVWWGGSHRRMHSDTVSRPNGVHARIGSKK